ncbi:MAG: hypothetical protein IPP33_06120, partial [Flavobacteriales bacterium]|nr:hypothetical protein [Flavobacteriales bacterium]
TLASIGLGTFATAMSCIMLRVRPIALLKVISERWNGSAWCVAMWLRPGGTGSIGSEWAKPWAAYSAVNGNQRFTTGPKWVPDNIGGRVRAIVVDPNNDQILWAGSVSGGLFRPRMVRIHGNAYRLSRRIWRIVQWPCWGMDISISQLGARKELVGKAGSGSVGDGVLMTSDDGETFLYPLNAAATWDK